MKYAVQLYSLRDMVKCGDDFLKILEEVKKLGFDGVEFAGYHGLSAETIKAKLDELGLVPVGCHIGVENRVGLIEIGKDADLVICDGSPFELSTKTEKVLINGKLVAEN